MKSIQARFDILSRRFPYHGSLIVFGRACRGQKFKRPTVAKFFRRLVDKNDYAKSDTMRLMKHFMKFTEDAENQGVKAAAYKD